VQTDEPLGYTEKTNTIKCSQKDYGTIKPITVNYSQKPDKCSASLSINVKVDAEKTLMYSAEESDMEEMIGNANTYFSNSESDCPILTCELLQKGCKEAPED